MPSRIFVIYLISFTIGVFFAPFFSISFEALLYFIFTLMLILPFTSKLNFLKHAVIGLIIITFGIIVFNNAVPKNNEDWINYFNGTEIALEGYVDSEPIGEKVNRFYFKPKLICHFEEQSDEKSLEILLQHSQDQNDNCSTKPKGRVVVTLAKTEKINFGEQLTLNGKLEEPKNSGEFNYKNYFLARKVYSEMNFPKVTLLRVQPSISLGAMERCSFIVREYLFSIKSAFVKSIESLYPEPNGSLMLGLLLGIKKTMPDELMDAFNKTGTTHIVALSGFNVTIIVMMLKSFTQYFSRRIRFWLPVSFIVLFVVMTGADAPIVRAAIMGFMLLLARQLGRQDDATVAVFFAGFVMILFNPMIIRYDVGFQLSFACMLGLIFIYPVFERLFKNWPKVVGESLGITLAAQIAAIPIILYYFGSLSVIAPLANFVILPLVPLAMGFGALAAFAYFIFPLLGETLAWIGYILTSYIINMAYYLSGLSFSSYDFKVGSVFVALYFVIVINLIVVWRNFQNGI